MSIPLRSRDEDRDADALAARLRALGLSWRVEAIEGMALLTPEGQFTLDASTRRAVVAAAREAGFANVALEIAADDDPVDHAPLPRGESI